MIKVILCSEFNHKKALLITPILIPKWNYMKSITKETRKKRKDQFDEFFEIAPEGIAILDIETMTFIKHNANACRILKFSVEELRTMGPQNISPEFQPDESRSEERIKEIVARVLKGEETVFEWLTINGAGETFMVL